MTIASENSAQNSQNNDHRTRCLKNMLLSCTAQNEFENGGNQKREEKEHGIRKPSTEAYLQCNFFSQAPRSKEDMDEERVVMLPEFVIEFGANSIQSVQLNLQTR